jgi:hypothetical protein
MFVLCYASPFLLSLIFSLPPKLKLLSSRDTTLESFLVVVLAGGFLSATDLKASMNSNSKKRRNGLLAKWTPPGDQQGSRRRGGGGKTSVSRGWLRPAGLCYGLVQRALQAGLLGPARDPHFA